MPLDLFVAKKELIKNHREPKVLTLDEDTKVVNKKIHQIGTLMVILGTHG